MRAVSVLDLDRDGLASHPKQFFNGLLGFILSPRSEEHSQVDVNDEPIVVEQTYGVAPDVVWRAITDPAIMRQWFFAPMAEFEPEPGFETEFVVQFEGREYLHQWRVTEVVPEARIAYRWRYGGFEGDSAVTWELSEAPGGTNLRLTHVGSESFPADPAFGREACVAGWTYFLQDSLKAHLGGA